MAEDSNNAELLALHRIDETCIRLQQQGNYLEALETMERGLVLRQHFFGPASDEVWKACKTVGELCNLLAMTYLQQEDFPMVLELLKKAEILTERDDKGRAVTYNNLACYYRRQGKLHAALQYLQRAITVEQRLVDVDNRADTHLNVCAVLSQLGRHAGALEHAQSALILLQEELFPGALGGDSEASSKRKSAGVDRIAVLAIAYHNIGVEQEFLKRYEMALESYRKGVEISETHLGENHGITTTLRSSFLAAKKSAPGSKGDKSQTKSSGALRIEPKGKKSTKGKQQQQRTRSPDAALKDEERWSSITKAYGDVALGVKPAPIVHEKYNLHEDLDSREAEYLANVTTSTTSSAPRRPTEDVPALPTNIPVLSGRLEPDQQRSQVSQDLQSLITPRENAIEMLQSEQVQDSDESKTNQHDGEEKVVREDKDEDNLADTRQAVEGHEEEEQVEAADDTEAELENVEHDSEESSEGKVAEEKTVDGQPGSAEEKLSRESKDSDVDGDNATCSESTCAIVFAAGWSKQFSKSKNREYYFNSLTGESRWNVDDVPRAEEEKQLDEEDSEGKSQ